MRGISMCNSGFNLAVQLPSSDARRCYAAKKQMLLIPGAE